MSSMNKNSGESSKQRQIRQAAQALFLERGFERTTTDSLASEAGVSKQTLYRYYESKERLLEDVLRHLIRDLAPQQLTTDTREGVPRSEEEVRTQLVQLAQSLLDNLMEPTYLGLVRVIISETPRSPHLGELFRSTVPYRVLEQVSGFIEQAQEAGFLRPVDADAAARMVVGPLLTHVLLEGLLEGEKTPSGPEVEQITVYVDGFLMGMKQEGRGSLGETEN